MFRLKPLFRLQTLRSSAGSRLGHLPCRQFSGTTTHTLFAPTEEHQQLREMVSTFSVEEIEPQALSHNATETFNRELFNKLGDLGLLGITVKEDYGGSGMDATAACIVHEEMSAHDPAFCLSYLAHSMLFVNNLHINGSEDQKHEYLPGACDGSRIGGMCMSEPGAGTDVLGMSTNAKQDGDDWILNGQKMWITNGCVDDSGETGDTYLVYAKTGEKRSDVTMFIVNKGDEGFSLGQKIENKCGMRASMTAELVFDNVRVPASRIVGQINGAAICMMRNLEIERVTLAAMSVGIARRCLEDMTVYSGERKAFGGHLQDFGQIQKNIAESYAEFMAGKTYVYNTSNSLDLNASGNVLDSDGVKLYCGVMAKNIADRAIQTMGGYGYVGEYRVEQLWRDSKLLEIGGGTNEAHHKNIVNWFKKTGSLHLR